MRALKLGADDYTPTKYKLLYELAVNAGRVLTNDQILQCFGEQTTWERAS